MRELELAPGWHVIGWALRWVLLCCGITLLGVGLLDRAASLLPDHGTAPGPDTRVAALPPRPAEPVTNSIAYTANQQGHVILDAVVNGAAVRFLVDTGASLVTLTFEDARAAGIDPRGLVFSGKIRTANGIVRMAPVTLREVRIGQLSIDDVSAAVLENLPISLLGMSFLGRLQSYEMRDKTLTMNW